MKRKYKISLVGFEWSNDAITISNCQYDGKLNAYAAGSVYIGGIIGYSGGSGSRLTIANCLNSGTLYCGEWDSGAWMGLGGIIGRMEADDIYVLENCLNVGTVRANNGNYGVGSIVGRLDSGLTYTFTNVYATNESCLYNGNAVAIGSNATSVDETTIITSVARDTIVGANAQNV